MIASADVLAFGPGSALILVLLLAASFFFSGTEMALTSLQKVDLAWMARQGHAGAQVTRLLAQRPAVIASVLIGNETVNIGIASIGAAAVTAAAPDRPWLNVVVVLPVLVLVSDMTPKVLAFRFNRLWALLAAWPFTTWFTLVTPIRRALTALIDPLARFFGATGKRAGDGLAEDELLIYVDRGTQTGAIDRLEAEIIEAVFAFDDLTVERLMTPRPDMETVPLGISWADLTGRLSKSRHSRIPVTTQRGDEIAGVLIVKDLLRLRRSPTDAPISIRPLLVPPVFVPASKSAETMLREFLDQKFHMAFVVDEHGTLVGLITLDDLLSELISEIDDDSAEDIADEAAGRYRGGIDLEDFSETSGIRLPECEYHTLAGFVFHHLGRLPRRGDVVEAAGHRFVVRHMEGRRIVEVAVVAIPVSE